MALAIVIIDEKGFCDCCFALITDVKIFDGFVRNENVSLQSERDDWEMRARYSVDKLYNFKKENEHQVIARHSKIEGSLCII